MTFNCSVCNAEIDPHAANADYQIVAVDGVGIRYMCRLHKGEFTVEGLSAFKKEI